MNLNGCGLTCRTPVFAVRVWRKPSKDWVSTHVPRDDVSTRDRADYTALVLTTQLWHANEVPRGRIWDLIKFNAVALFYLMNATYQFVLAVLNTEHGSLSEPPMPGVKRTLQNEAHHAQWIIWLSASFFACNCNVTFGQALECVE